MPDQSAGASATSTDAPVAGTPAPSAPAADTTTAPGTPAATTTTASTTDTPLMPPGDGKAESARATSTDTTATPTQSALPTYVTVLNADETSTSSTSVTTNAVKRLDMGPGYYVDSVAGDDANAGTSTAPFKTLGRLATLHLQAGEGIYLHCGSVWRETLTLSATQMVDGSILGNYGTGCTATPPRITGANDFSTGWTRGSNGVWSRPVPAGTPKIARLFVDGTAMHTAQWPNDSNGTTTLAQASALTIPSTTSFSISTADQIKLSGKDLLGATAYMRTEPWLMESSTVRSYVGGLVTLTSATQYPELPLAGYAFTDKLWMVDAPGEFFHDTAANMLYLMPPTSVDTAGLNLSVVEGAVRDNALWIGNRNHVSVSGIQTDMARTDGIMVANLPNATFTGITSSHNGRSGIRIFTTTPVTGADRNANISGSLFADNYQYGVDASTANRVNLSGSRVLDTGTIGWLGNTFAGVSLGDGGVDDSNRVQRSAYIGIRYSGGGGSIVNNNDITSYCLRLSDCGGIYTWNGPKTGSITTDRQSSVTINRIGPAAAIDTYPVAGIYLDEHTMGTTVRSNSISGTPYGIFVQNASGNLIDSNKLWLNTIACLWASATESDMNSLANNTFSNNQLAPVSSATGTYPALPHFSTAYAIQFWTVYPDLSTITSGSNQFIANQIMQLQSGTAPTVITKTASGTTVYSQNQWKAVTSRDAWSTPAVYEQVNATLANELVVSGDFANGLTDWTTWYSPPVTASVTAATSQVGCSGMCAVFKSDTDLDLLYSQGMSLSSGAMYVAKFTAGFTSSAAVVPPYLTLTTAPYSTVWGTDGQTFIGNFTGTTGDALKTETYFHASGNVTSRINLKVLTPNTTVNFDNVSVRKITGYATTKPSDWSAVVQSPGNAATSVTCAKLGWPSTCQVIDEQGTVIAMPATIPAGTSKLLLRADSPARIQ